MNRKLLIVLCALCLTACGTHTARGVLPVSDLSVLKANVTRDARPVLLPNGKEYCAELARTEDEQDNCMGDLEDGLFKANRKLERVGRTVDAFATGEVARRQPCNAFQRMFLKRCRSQ